MVAVAQQPAVLYSKRGPVASLVLNRPDVVNAYNLQMRDELYATLEAVRDDPDVRVAILRGAGERGFCAGADLTEFGTAPSLAVARKVRWERDVWGLFLSMPKPLVAAVHGHVIGSGVEMTCLCDVRLAADDAEFSMPEVGLGLVPAAGGTQTLPRDIGVAGALDMLIAGRRLSASEARHRGLVHRVVPAGILLAEAEAVAVTLASYDAAALAAARRAMREGSDMSLAGGLDLEARLAASLPVPRLPAS